MPRTRLALTGALLAVTLTSAACAGAVDDGPAQVTDLNADHLHGRIVESLEPPAQTLTDTRGAPFSFRDRPDDEVTVLFFGYTHCPDVCPATMGVLTSARAQVPEELRDRVQVVFVTEDPERDTDRALRRWLDRFDPDHIGLRGGNETTAAMLDGLHLDQTSIDPSPTQEVTHPDTADGHHDHGTYGVEHAGSVYAFAPGDRVVLYTAGATAREYAEDFTALLEDQ